MEKYKLPEGISYKFLKDYTYAELMEFLKQNENVDARVLACVCSEILRRQLLPEAPQ